MKNNTEDVKVKLVPFIMNRGVKNIKNMKNTIWSYHDSSKKYVDSVK